MAKSFEDSVLAKLNSILRVLTVSVTQGKKQVEQIALLNRVGFQPIEIADLLGTTRNTVNVALSNLRKSESKGTRRKKQR